MMVENICRCQAVYQAGLASVHGVVDTKGRRATLLMAQAPTVGGRLDHQRGFDGRTIPCGHRLSRFRRLGTRPNRLLLVVHERMR